MTDQELSAACWVPSCKRPPTWWTCWKCGAHCCHEHQRFVDVKVVECAACAPTIQFLWRKYVDGRPTSRCRLAMLITSIVFFAITLWGLMYD